MELAVASGLFSVLLSDTTLPGGGMQAPLTAEVFGDPETALRVWFGEYDDAFTRLPDRRIAAAPYALQAERAATALSADLLDGSHAGAFQQHYANVVVVAKAGGDFTTITDALNSITDASDANRCLVWVAPGVYTEQVVMKPYVDIEGAGELLTRITHAGWAANSAGNGTLLGTDNVEVRHLTVENTGGAAWAVAINNWGHSPRLTHLTATACGSSSFSIGVQNQTAYTEMKSVTAYATGAGTNEAVSNSDGSPVMTDVRAQGWGGADSRGVTNAYASPEMNRVTAIGETGGYAYGVYNTNASPKMTDVVARAQDGATENYGICDVSSAPTMNGVTVSASGSAYNFGVRNVSTSWPVMNNVNVTVSGGAAGVAVRNDDSSATMQNSAFSATGAAANYGILNYGQSGSRTVTVENCQVTGSTNTLFNDTAYVTRVGASKLAGGNVSGAGALTCIGVYDENFTRPGYNLCP